MRAKQNATRRPRPMRDGPLGYAILKAIRQSGNRRIRAA